MQKPDSKPPPSGKYDPDNGHNGVQAGCGAIIGLLLPLGGGTYYGWNRLGGGGSLAVLCVLSALVCGALAWKWGDRFWEGGFRKWWM